MRLTFIENETMENAKNSGQVERLGTRYSINLPQWLVGWGRRNKKLTF